MTLLNNRSRRMTLGDFRVGELQGVLIFRIWKILKKCQCNTTLYIHSRLCRIQPRGFMTGLGPHTYATVVCGIRSGGTIRCRRAVEYCPDYEFIGVNTVPAQNEPAFYNADSVESGTLTPGFSDCIRSSHTCSDVICSFKAGHRAV
jgi:hypothetical protein